jgi:hypothetical protein
MIKKFNTNNDSTRNDYGVVVFFNCRKHPPVNSASQVALRDLEPAGTETVSRSCNSQLALFKSERQRYLRPVVALSKTCLQQI